jgi:hypothetical protein
VAVPPPLSNLKPIQPLSTVNNVIINIIKLTLVITCILHVTLLLIRNKDHFASRALDNLISHTTFKTILKLYMYSRLCGLVMLCRELETRNIFAVTFIICRLPDILEALVEWKYESAEGKTTGSNFSILHTKNFRLKSVAENTGTGSNGRVCAINQLRTVRNTSSIFYNHGRG